MSEENTKDNEASAVLDELKNRADTLGISYHPSIGVDKLRSKVSEKMEENESKEETGSTEEVDTSKPKQSARTKATNLIRVRVTCMNPNKKEYEGELFMVGNSVIGTVKRFVPFDVDWHVPEIIYQIIKDRKYQTFVTVKDRNGNKSREGKLVNAYAVEVLKPLSDKEMKELAQRQAMAAGSSD
jgi:hypothetical protein